MNPKYFEMINKYNQVIVKIFNDRFYHNENVEMGEQKFFTPILAIDHIANFVFYNEANKYDNLCWMYNPEGMEYHFILGLTDKHYTFCFDSGAKRDRVKIMEKRYKLKYPIKYIDIRNMKYSGKKSDPMRFENIMAKKHFDVIFTNPPYNDGKDIKLLQALIDNDIADEIICVHPATFLFNHNGTKSIEAIKATKTLKEVTLFWGNNMFDDTKVRHAHCISIWNKNHNSDEVTINDKAFTKKSDIYNTDTFVYTTNVNEVTVHSKVAEKAVNLLKKFINCDNILDHRIYVEDTKKKTDFGAKFPTMTGNIDNENGYFKDDFFVCFVNDKDALENVKVGKDFKLTDFMMTHEGYKKYYPLWYFNSEEERDNFINYCKLKCVRFLLSLIKHNPELNTTKPCRIIPWMDFTKHYTEEDLKKAWGIDEELWDYIDKFIPDYYEDYKEISK